ncbi:hypothetical protein LCGC14_2984680 [marine sediment metagenome]|uniref:Uncharacterized protein n=1 Tax=marine sediment metagenome TaxID=412755 RepID=A0A0F8ZWT9_9ZZZZ
MFRHFRRYNDNPGPSGEPPALEGDDPFGGMHDTLFAWESFGEDALKVGWTVVQEVPPQVLRDKNGIISCGKRAGQWLQYVVDGDVPSLMLPVPQYFYTHRSEVEVEDICKTVQAFIKTNARKG